MTKPKTAELTITLPVYLLKKLQKAADKNNYTPEAVLTELLTSEDWFEDQLDAWSK